MLQYLGIIEQRTNELLAVQTYLLAKVGLKERERERAGQVNRDRWTERERSRIRERGGSQRKTDVLLFVVDNCIFPLLCLKVMDSMSVRLNFFFF